MLAFISKPPALIIGVIVWLAVFGFLWGVIRRVPLFPRWWVQLMIGRWVWNELLPSLARVTSGGGTPQQAGDLSRYVA
jgi:hypothetical protein